MFDGNHRTRRSNINLSSSTKRRQSRKNNAGAVDSTASNSRPTAVEESKRLREERLEKQRRKEAAIEIQKRWRGFRCRMAIVSDMIDDFRFYDSLGTDSTTSTDSTAGTSCTGISSSNNQKIEIMWNSIARLLSPTLLPFIPRIYNDYHRNRHLLHPEEKVNVHVIIAHLLSIVFLRLQHTTSSKSCASNTDVAAAGFGQKYYNDSYQLQQNHQLAYRIRRIVKHCLLFLYSLLHQKNKSTMQSQHLLHLATSILQLLDSITSQYSNILHIIIPTSYFYVSGSANKSRIHTNNTDSDSAIEILQILATCAQDYYHTLTWATKVENKGTNIVTNTGTGTGTTPRSCNFSTTINLPLLYNITRQLIHFTCYTCTYNIINTTTTTTTTSSSSSSTLQPSLNYLSVILLGIDLQPLFNSDLDDNITYNTDSSYSPYTIFHECAQFYFNRMQNGHKNDCNMHEQNTVIHSVATNDNIEDTSNVKFVYLLFNSLHTSIIMNSNQRENQDIFHYYSSFILEIMKGYELNYIQNALLLMELNDKTCDNNTNRLSLCFTILQLLVLFLGLTKQPEQMLKQSNGNLSNHSLALNILIGLVALGDTTISNLNSDTTNDMELDDEDALEEEYNIDDDEEEMNGEHQDSNSNISKHQIIQDDEQHFRSIKLAASKFKSDNHSSKSKLYKRQDLQTISRLDQLYRTNVNYARQELYKYLKTLPQEKSKFLIDMARIIGTGDHMLEWALILFPQNGSMKKRKMSNDRNDVDKDMEYLRDLFVSVLSNTLSYCSGIKSKVSVMSPILSKLAFQSQWMEQYWQYVQEQLNNLEEEKDSLTYSKQLIKAYRAASSFCDLFVHNLLAMDDEEFLLAYTTCNPNCRPKSSILATDLIETLNSNLFKMYWRRPVLANDVILPTTYAFNCSIDAMESCQRARYLLSGTKLWNALHQRWSRLFTTAKFCDDECWYFPRLVTRGNDEDGAVFGTRTEDVEMGDHNDDNDDNSTGSMDISSHRSTAVVVADEENDELASSFKDPKMARILTSVPQALPFERRVKLFNSLLAADLARAQDESQAARNMMLSMLNGEEGAQFSGRIQAKIHRDQLYHDSMDQLNKLGSKLKKKISVTFTNQVGAVEAGIDGGGLFREFLDDLIKDAFHPERRHGNVGPLFTVSPLQTLAVNTCIPVTAEVLNHYQFLGRVL